MTELLDITNFTAAGLNLIVAAFFFVLGRAENRRSQSMATVLSVFFLLRAVDRVTSPGESLIPYSAGVDLAVNVALIGALVALVISARSYMRRINSTIDTATDAANRDSLTGLLNRRGWEQSLTSAMADARANNRPLVVTLLDLDHFKAFNDEYGHVAGDELLKATAHGWESIVRDRDVIGRYGGEEFIGILPNCRPEIAQQVAERLRTATPFGQTCSLGVATWDGRETAEEIIARADAALYRAKSGGRNRVVLDAVHGASTERTAHAA